LKPRLMTVRDSEVMRDCMNLVLHMIKNNLVDKDLLKKQMKLTQREIEEALKKLTYGDRND